MHQLFKLAQHAKKFSTTSGGNNFNHYSSGFNDPLRSIALGMTSFGLIGSGMAIFSQGLSDESKFKQFRKAEKENNFDTLEGFILETPKIVDEINGDGCTLLHLAAQNGHINVVSLLLKNGANVHANQTKFEGVNIQWTPLHSAVCDYRVPNKEEHDQKIAQILELLLKQPSAKVDVRDVYGNTPLYIAADRGFLKSVKTLVKHNADVNSKCYAVEEIKDEAAKAKHDEAGRTPLHNVVREQGDKEELRRDIRHVKVMQYLIEAGAKCDAEDAKGKTPLDFTETVTDQKIREQMIYLLENCLAKQKTAPQMGK